jgi:hypothetical protein
VPKKKQVPKNGSCQKMASAKKCSCQKKNRHVPNSPSARQKRVPKNGSVQKNNVKKKKTQKNQLPKIIMCQKMAADKT